MKVKELVINANKQFYKLESIGWDIVITPNGPVILEGNDDWEIGGHRILLEVRKRDG